jgi:hypothetical protein
MGSRGASSTLVRLLTVATLAVTGKIGKPVNRLTNQGDAAYVRDTAESLEEHHADT